MNSKQTVLIAEDDQELRDVLVRRCRQLGLDAISVDNALDALQAAKASQPDVICMDVELPGGNGLAACEMLAADETVAAIPRIVLTGKKESEVERRCHELATYYVPKAADTWSRLEPLLKELLRDNSVSRQDPGHQERARNASAPIEQLIDDVFSLVGTCDEIFADVDTDRQPWVLCIDDDVEFSNGLKKRLQSRDIGVINAFDGVEGCTTAVNCAPDAIVLDYNMPYGTGDEVLQRLKNNYKTRDIPVVVLTGRTEPQVKLQMMNLGATAFFTKPVTLSTFVEELLAHARAARSRKSLLPSS